MTTTPILAKEHQHLVQPDENIMFERKGFDRRGLRRELAAVTAIDSTTKWVEQGQTVFIHPESDMPGGPTSEAESFGNIELIRQTGTSVQIPRYTNGFTLEDEDAEISEMASFIQDMRDGIMELFDLQADIAFFNGLYDQAGNQVFSGVLDWVQEHMPADNIIDCAEVDPAQGIPANVILRDAYSKVSGEYVTNTWDVAVMRPEMFALWNEIGRADYNVNRSQWEMVQDDADGVGVQRRFLYPHRTGLRAPTNMDAGLKFDLEMPAAESAASADRLDDIIDDPDDDVMFLIPQHNGDFYELYEMPTPDVRGPIQQRGFREEWEYKWRAGVVQGMSHRAEGEAPDVIKLENVSVLFNESAE